MLLKLSTIEFIQLNDSFLYILFIELIEIVYITVQFLISSFLTKIYFVRWKLFYLDKLTETDAQLKCKYFQIW